MEIKFEAICPKCNKKIKLTEEIPEQVINKLLEEFIFVPGKDSPGVDLSFATPPMHNRERD